jgi:hypothetical protein
VLLAALHTVVYCKVALAGTIAQSDMAKKRKATELRCEVQSVRFCDLSNTVSTCMFA